MWNVIPRERDLMNSERTSRLVPLLLMIVCLCAVSFFLGGMFFSEKQKLLLVENEASNPRNSMDCTEAVSKPLAFNACAISYQDYTPCMDPRRWKKFDRHRFAFRERHCPPPSQRLECLVPPPKGYKIPLTWPESRDKCWYRNVPYDWINRVKSNQHWLRKEGELFFFPGGGTMFPNGVNEYLDLMQELIPETKDGRVRTALDVGCGVASWGGALLDRGILTMSVAPRDNHEAQVQFALERGIPAMLGILSTQRLPYPSSAFDIAHCSRCLIHWTAFGGIYLMEIDRVLRPGGFWVLSGPPINYEYHWRGWNSTFEEQKASYDSLQQMLTNMCYKLYAKKGNIAVWQKPIDNTCYVTRAKTAYPTVCDDSIEADAAWYVPIRACLVTCNPYYKRLGVGQLPRWPERLNGIPERIRSVSGGNARAFKMDSEKWVKRVKHYKTLLPELGSEKIRNVMDMNTMYGSFAAALINDPVWVMNVVSTYAPNSLNVVFDRGLIGTYNDWCEAFSTYPRTYDLLHLDGLFTAESHRCEMKFVLLEMDRILRPEGYVIISDDLHFVRKVIDLGSAIRWNCEIKGAINERKEQKSIIICQKTFWRS